MFHGSGGHGKWRDDFIVRRIPNPVGKPRSEVKTLLRPRRFAHSWAHHPVGYRKRPYAYMDSSGNPFVPHPERGVPHLQNPLAEMAWINHYYYKSTEEFLVKQSRNRGAFPTIMGVTNTLLDNGGVHGFMDQFCRTGSALADPRQRRQVSMTSSLA